MTSLTAVVVTCGCLGLMLLYSACGIGGPSLKSAVAVEEKSPDGTMTAVVVDRYAEDESDPYEVVVGAGPSNTNIKRPIQRNDVEKYVVMTASAPATIGLYWQDSNTLIVTCVLCKLRPRDIQKRSDHLGSIIILYRGFPVEPADSTTHP